MDSNYDPQTTCPVCLEDLVLVNIDGNCQDNCCNECLKTHFKRLKSKGEKASCPTCKGECSFRIGDSDESGEDRTIANDVADSEAQVGDLDHQTVVDVKCQLCYYNKKEIQAANSCPECGVYLCEGCSSVHPKQKATQNHKVIPLRSEANKGEAFCATHKALLMKYCKSCKKAVCKLCVNLDHADHEVEDLWAIIARKSEEGKALLQQRDSELKKLQNFRKNLLRLNTCATKMDKQDDLFKEVEDHAEKCVEHIVEWKYGVKEHITEEYKIIKEIMETYARASDIEERLKGPVSKMDELLSKTITNPLYLESVTAIHHDLEAVPKMNGNIDENYYEEKFADFKHRDPTFSPRTTPLPLGKLEINDFYPKQIGSHDFGYCDSADEFIPSVAILSCEKFAIALPAVEEPLTNLIHIYQFPDTHFYTLTPFYTLTVDGFFDMSSTFEGHLAVLSDHNITIFAQRTDHNDHTPVYYKLSTIRHNISEPRSLGVGLQNQYIILSGGKNGKGQITVLNNENDRVQHEITTENPTRISCSPRYIFILGYNVVDAYEMKYTTFLHSKSLHPGEDGVVKDISATSWEHLGMIQVEHDTKRNTICLVRQTKNIEKKWRSDHTKIHSVVSHAKHVECRVSTSAQYIVVSWGTTFTVYKYQQHRHEMKPDCCD